MNTDNEIGSDVKWLWAIGLTLIGLCLVAAFATGILKPWSIAQEEKANTNSQMFITTQVSQLTSWQTEYERLETRILEQRNDPDMVAQYKKQQAGILNDMVEARNKIPKDKVPPRIQEFMAARGKA